MGILKANQQVRANKNKAKVAALTLLEMGGYSEPPFQIQDIIDLIRIIYRCKLIVKGGNLSSKFSGQYSMYNNIVGILYNENDSQQRKRFTIAHELGHFVLKHNAVEVYQPELIEFKSKIPHEIEANTFAAELLMPSFAINLETEINKYNIASIASKYNVSKEALMWRVMGDTRLTKSTYVPTKTNDSTTQLKEKSTYDISEFYPPPEFENSNISILEYYSQLHIDDLKELHKHIIDEGEEDYDEDAFSAICTAIKSQEI